MPSATAPRLNFKVTMKWFTNVTRLETAKTRKERKVLYSTGGYGRKVIRSTIRGVAVSRRGSVSPPGTPPYGHTGKLKKSVLFQVYMHNRRDVVIGPRKFPRSISTVPALLEFGGRALGRRRRRGRRLIWHYRPRPFVFRNMKKTQAAMRRFMKEVSFN